MEVKNYRPRLADAMLAERLEYRGAVLIEGPKWCGKTSTAMMQAQSLLNLADTTTLARTREIVDLSPDILLDGATPRLIDEWQTVPRLWDIIRNTVDRRQEPGQFILTGSAVPAHRNEIIHTGTGRFSRLMMRSMSLFESGESSGAISLKRLFDDDEKPCTGATATLDDIAWYICRGGWPLATTLKTKAAIRQAADYIDAVVNYDISSVDGIQRSASITRRLLRSYARHTGLQSTLTTIRDDISTSGDPISIDTVSSYIESLKRIFVIENTEAWNPNLRSKTAIRSTDTRYLTDPSLGCAALGIGPSDLIHDLKTMGMMFENLCVRDLRIYAEYLDGNIYHYRDANGLECDSVVHLRDGRYGLIEIKLGGEQLINDGVRTITSLASKIDVTRMHAPSFMMILTAIGDYAYRRSDGIWIVPITMLGI